MEQTVEKKSQITGRETRLVGAGEIICLAIGESLREIKRVSSPVMFSVTTQVGKKGVWPIVNHPVAAARWYVLREPGEHGSKSRHKPSREIVIAYKKTSAYDSEC